MKRFEVAVDSVAWVPPHRGWPPSPDAGLNSEKSLHRGAASPWKSLRLRVGLLVWVVGSAVLYCFRNPGKLFQAGQRVIVWASLISLLIVTGQAVPITAQVPTDIEAQAPPALTNYNDAVGPGGGQIMSPDGRIHVTVPPGAVAEDSDVILSSSAVPDESTVIEFDVQLIALGEKTALPSFQLPVSIGLSLTADDVARVGPSASSLLVKRLDGMTNSWAPAGGSVDLSKNMVLLNTNLTGRFAVGLSTPIDKGATISVNAAEGGILTADDGLIVDFPSGATAENLRIEYKPSERKNFSPSSLRIVRQFELNAFAVNRGDARVSKFSKPVQLTAPHSAKELSGLRGDSLRLYVWDDSTSAWTDVPNQSLEANGTISASLDHFSVYSTQTAEDIAAPGLNLYHQVDLHSGSANLSYPIEMPAGPGGFQPPQLALSYSSSGVNEMKSRTNLGSWAGIGWDIAIPAVIYNPLPAPGRFFLSMDGMFDELISRGTDPDAPASTRYSTSNETYMRIRGNSLTAAPPGTVEVTDKKGTKYIFGGTVLGTANLDFQRWYYKSDTDQKIYYRLDLARVIDPNSNYADYYYYRDLFQVSCPPSFQSESPCKNVRAAYLARVEWGDTNPNDGSDHKFRVYIGETSEASLGAPGLEFTRYSNLFQYIRADDPVCDQTLPFSAPPVMETRRLKELRIQTLVGSSWETSRRYTFDYDPSVSPQTPGTCSNGVASSGHLKLTGFNQYGRSSGTAPGNLLFGMMFFYDTNLPVAFRNAPTGICPGSFVPSWPFLRTVWNGFGGQTRFFYVERWQSDPNASCTWARQVVYRKEDDGGGVPGQYAYTYQTYGYEDGPKYYLPSGGSETDAQFRGFRKVTQTNPLGDYMKCHYFTTGVEPDAGFFADPVTGNWFKCEWYDASQGAVIKHIDPTWLPRQIAPGINFVYKAWEWTYADNLALETWYTYDGYGNQIQILDRGPRGQVTNTRYFPNVTNWIVSLPALESVAGLSTRTWHYDQESPATDGSDYSTPPVKGNLTGTWQWEAFDLNNGPSGPHRRDLSKYDVYGNVRERTKYRDGLPILSTTLSYDTNYHGFLASETFAVDGVTHQTQYQYDFVLAKKTLTTDPNGAVYRVDYDEFGRIQKEWEPGDLSWPTREYHYEWDTTSPYTLPQLTWVSHRESNSGPSTLDESFLFDGLGYQVQHRSEVSTGSSCVAAVIDTILDGDVEGRVRSTSVPYTSTVAGPCRVVDFTAPSPSARWTNTDYDAIGRMVKVTNPDAASSYRTVSYSGYTETLVDENLHETETVHDAYGRTASVNEYKGNGQTGNPYVLDATTTYQYDVLDRMTRINDAASPSNQTDIQYAAPLGFRSQLTDPDTGTQLFTYYDDGLLKARTDARGEVVTSTYDGLDRIKAKSYSGPVASPTITYTYDTCQLNCPELYGSKGHLTMVEYADYSQRYRYTYDIRGRLIIKLSEIDGQGYGVQHEYDPMDRETKTWYPGGEMVTRTFDSQGLTETVSGQSTYLSSTTYNAAGQPTQLAFGNGKTQDFTYKPELRLSTLTLNTITPITYTYNYDPKGNLSSIQDSSIQLSNQTTTFGYDERDRLISAGGATAPTRSTFEYDKIGNMTRKEEGPIEGVARETAAQCASPGDEDNDGKINDGCTNNYSGLCYAPQQTGCSGVASGLPHATKTVTGNSPNFGYSSTFTGTNSYDAMGNLLEMSGSNGPNNGSLGLLMRLHKTGEGYDAEGRLQKVEYNKLDSGTDLGFYDVTGDCQVTSADEIAIHQGSSWNKSVGQAGYNPLYDLNSSGRVFQDDLDILNTVMNKSCPQMTYDQDGQLVKVSGPKNVVYIDGIYEKNLDTSVGTKYYFADGRRIAMSAGSVLSYLADDHLGSTAFIMDSAGALMTHLRYYAYGMTWSQGGSNPATDLLFTGFRRMGSKSGTYYANARFYSADTGRFLQPDSFMPDMDPTHGMSWSEQGAIQSTVPCQGPVCSHSDGHLGISAVDTAISVNKPDCALRPRGSERLTNGELMKPTDPRVLNKYAYVVNNPTNYVDSSGHQIETIGYINWGDIRPTDLNLSGGSVPRHCSDEERNDALLELWRCEFGCPDCPAGPPILPDPRLPVDCLKCHDHCKEEFARKCGKLPD